jgi:hypothetical protein
MDIEGAAVPAVIRAKPACECKVREFRRGVYLQVAAAELSTSYKESSVIDITINEAVQEKDARDQE